MITQEPWAEADTLAREICGCANGPQHRADVAKLLTYREASYEAGRLARMEQAAVIADAEYDELARSRQAAQAAKDLGVVKTLVNQGRTASRIASRIRAAKEGS